MNIIDASNLLERFGIAVDLHLNFEDHYRIIDCLDDPFAGIQKNCWLVVEGDIESPYIKRDYSNTYFKVVNDNRQFLIIESSSESHKIAMDDEIRKRLQTEWLKTKRHLQRVISN